MKFPAAAAAIAKQLALILLGSAVYAFGLHYFVLPNELMEGGITGVGILLNYAVGIPLSYTTLLLNIPLFLIGLKILGRRGMALTAFGTLALTFFLYLMERATEAGWVTPFASEHDLFLASLYAGVTLGAGLGIVFRSGGTTGGADILARIVQRKTGLSLGRFFLFFDAAVISASLLFISTDRVLYTLVSVFAASRVIDIVQRGKYAASAFTIITNRADEIAQQLMEELDRGATIIPAKGAFTGEDRKLLYCVVQRQESRRLEMIVRRVDPRAFMIIADVRDVLGEGFPPDASGA